jgi:phosphonate transport system permease protein
MMWPSQNARRMWATVATFAAFLGGFLAYLNVEPVAVLFQGQHLQNLFRDVFPPRLAVLWERSGLWWSVVETLAMAFAGTTLGLAFALPAGLAGAANTTPHGGLRAAVRFLLSLERALSSFFILMVLLIAFGLGPFAATITLALGTLGGFGKLFAESLERVEAAPAEALAALGASRSQQICFAVLPQAAPALITGSLYAFDINLRAAIALGIFGAGGLGAELLLAYNTLRYHDVLALALVSLVLVTAVERVSDFLRQRI